MSSDQSIWDKVSNFIDRLYSRQSDLERKVDTLLIDVEFIRRRLSTYLGAGRAVTYLDDSNPIYVNSNDFGPPANLINGGAYEQDNLDVMFSFLKADSVFLDIGANVGIFSIKVASRLRQRGKVHAFEPHPELATLMRGSAHLNGLGGLSGATGGLVVHQVALGKIDEDGTFVFPENHLGGGTRGIGSATITVSAPVRTLDGYFAPDFKFDIAKIDVEGHELSVLQGMQKTLERCPQSVVVFEKHGQRRGYEPKIEEFFRNIEFRLFHIGHDAKLAPLQEGQLATSSGDFVACRVETIAERYDRRFFKIAHKQFLYPQGATELRDHTSITGKAGEILFHGPYWHLKKGLHRITIDAEINGAVRLSICHSFGHQLASFQVTQTKRTFDLVVERDLVHFECVARAEADVEMTLASIECARIG